MDVVEILNNKIKAMPSGPHSAGLSAVRSHVEAAARHMSRGQIESDISLFTNVVFRCNQAFEGSIKEAYRVIAAKDPSKQTPAHIEEFFSNNTIYDLKS